MKLPALCSVFSAALLCVGCSHMGQPAAASARIVCKDGTALTPKGDCGGHGGIDRQATAARSQTLRQSQVSGAAAANRPGEVWATPATKSYVCEGQSEYGKTKEGQYMSEGDAQSKGMHPAHGKRCSE